MFKLGDIVYIIEDIYKKHRFPGNFLIVNRNYPLEIVDIYSDGVYIVKGLLHSGHNGREELGDQSCWNLSDKMIEARNIDFCECTNEKLFKVGCSCGFLTRILKKVKCV